MRSDAADAVPVTVITGFLGSGKTTVLNQLLRAPDLAGTAVIVNEFGEVSLDHLLIEQAIENAVLLKNGCICCTVRGDLLDTIEELFRKRDAGELPPFRRIAIETTGLADPAPVVHTLLDTSRPCPLDGIVVTADAVHISAQLRERAEARNQIAFADRVLLTKTDLVSASDVDKARLDISAYNDRALIQRVTMGEIAPDHVFGLGPDRDPAHWLRPTADADHDHAHHHHHHEDGFVSTILRIRDPVAPDALMAWLNSLLSLHGADIPRLKGIVRLTGVAAPIVLQAVHHVVHPPVALSPRAAAAWAGDGCEIVVIHRGLADAGLRASFSAVVGGSSPVGRSVSPMATTGPGAR